MRTKEQIQEAIRVWEGAVQQYKREYKEYCASPQGQLMLTAPYPDPILEMKSDTIRDAQRILTKLYEERKTAR